MSRKKKNSKNINGAEEQLPAGTDDNLTEPVAAGEDAPVVDENNAPLLEESTSSDDGGEETSDEASPDDILDDVRRALIEEDEAAESQKQSKWWRRIGRGSSKPELAAEEQKVVEEINLPAPAMVDADIEEEIDELKDELESEEYLDQIDELIELLDEEPTDEIKFAPVIEEPQPEPEKPVDLEELKKQAFQPRTTADSAETLSEVRSIALDGDENVFVEVEAKPQDPLDERLKSVENALKPYRRYINFAIAFLGVVIAGIALAIIYSVYQRSQPEPVVEQVSSLPFPTGVSLPGGWSFMLGKGVLADGRWQPKGAEWLEGTEVCRWVSLPWSRQLEAVLRTLNPDDPIELQMSNSDRLVYKVYSIQQMSLEEMQALDSNSPCLLIMLAQDDVEKRWVLTALP